MFHHSTARSPYLLVSQKTKQLELWSQAMCLPLSPWYVKVSGTAFVWIVWTIIRLILFLIINWTNVNNNNMNMIHIFTWFAVLAIIKITLSFLCTSKKIDNLISIYVVFTGKWKTYLVLMIDNFSIQAARMRTLAVDCISGLNHVSCSCSLNTVYPVGVQRVDARLWVFVSTALFNWWCVCVIFQVAGKMRRGQTAGQRWPETASAPLSSNTPCWWRRPAARSSPAAWRTTAALISWAKCRPNQNTPRDWTLWTQTHPAHLGLTHRHSHISNKRHHSRSSV